MKFKNGVNPFGIRPELMLALIVADKIWEDNGQELVVTSLNDSRHSKSSLHYAGFAGDLRTNYFTHDQKLIVSEQLIDSLGKNPDYDIVVEETHIHVEYQPKYRGG